MSIVVHLTKDAIFLKYNVFICHIYTDCSNDQIKFRYLVTVHNDLHKVMNCGLRQWQTQVKDLISVYDDRTIIMIVDVEGNCGKSAFAEYMEYEGLAYEIPPMRLMEDIMACCMSIPTQTCYMVDLPRAMKKDKLSDFFSGLECLKNGVMYDKRYKFKKKRIDCPQVIVFSNKYPDKNYLSPDRWKMYNIVDNQLERIKRE